MDPDEEATKAAALLRAGVHVTVVQEQLGHATLDETITKHGHLMPDSDGRP